jgi:mannose-1-phosphate guanylyltransferase
VLPDNITPVILAGGPGYRLKPWSRPTCPKPFLKVRGVSLLQSTLERLKGYRPLILCHQDHVGLAREQGLAMAPKATFLIEPAMKNTGPALAAATAHLLAEKGPDALMLVMPSDHAIDRPDILMNEVRKHQNMGQGRILSFGIKPRQASSRFGYILPQGDSAKFIEKPERADAKKLIAQGAYWNSGIWMARVGTMQALFKELAPDLWQSAQNAVTYARHDGIYTYLEPRYFNNCPTISVDRAVMEKAGAITMVPLDLRWRDLGTWPSMMVHLTGL